MDDKTRQGSMIMAGDQAECSCPQPGPETIQVEQVLGASMQQRVVEAAMMVPDPKPDIEQVIDVYVKDLKVKSIDVISGKVVVRGDLEVKVMYVAQLPNQPVHAFEQDHVRWTRDIQIADAKPGMSATADVAAEYVGYDFDPANPRQIYITIVLKVWTRVVTTTEMDVTTLAPISQGNQVEVSTASAAESMTTGGSPSTVEYETPNVVVTPGAAPTTGTQAPVAGTATVTGNGVNVRTGPGTNFPVVTQVDKGEVVTLKDQAFGWNKVVLSDGNTTGWIAGWLLNVG